MTTQFKKGDTVKIVVDVPQGPVEALRMTEDGDVQYLISWTDPSGNQHQRWFDEAQLVSA